MIPKDVKDFVRNEVARFNREFGEERDVAYLVRFRGDHAYFDLDEGGFEPGPTFRLKFTGDLANWEFAIFRWSIERYDPDAWYFPGADLVDGTIEGALEAGYRAYR